MSRTLGADVQDDLYEAVEDATAEKQSKSAYVREAVQEKLESEAEPSIRGRIFAGVALFFFLAFPVYLGWSGDLVSASLYVGFAVFYGMFTPEVDSVVSRLRDRLS